MMSVSMRSGPPIGSMSEAFRNSLLLASEVEQIYPFQNWTLCECRCQDAEVATIRG
jgi:hypothetical protein